LSSVHPDFDWHQIARQALTSRKIDELEESDLTQKGLVTYQFSARGHELGQCLISQLLDQPFDAAAAYYRSRPFMLGVGLTVEEALASSMARQSGISAGRDVGVVFNMPKRSGPTIVPTAADVGSQYTPMSGWAQAIQYRIRELGQHELKSSIAVAFGGDGSVAANGFWSALTTATTLKLPLLFFIEDNGYAISVQRELQTPGGDIAANLASFEGLQIWSGSGVQPLETAELVLSAVNYVRGGEGPGLLRLRVPRLAGHSSMDNQAYKSKETLAEEKERDPIPILRDYLVPEFLTEKEWTQLLTEVEQSVAEACDAAQSQSQPDPGEVTYFAFSSADAVQQVGGLAAEGLSLPAGTTTVRVEDPRRINMVDAIRRTLDVELAINDRCLIFGEDVAIKGGVHTATMGLAAKYGSRRVFDTSLSEEGIIGRAVGFALAGLMPVPEIQFRKYADPATEQLNNCGTLRWRSANNFAAPMVVRMPGGFGRKIGDPWHSVTNEAAFAHGIGWQMAFPSNAEDSVGLLRTALRGNDPVVFFEHRALLDAAWSRRPYPGNDYVVPFGKARIISAGDDMTVVTWGAMVERCEAAAKELEAREEASKVEDSKRDSSSIELIDLRTIVPWDEETVLESVRKTSKCLIVHEDIGLAGFGAEIAATIAEEAFLDLDGPIKRVTAPSVPVPFNLDLMKAVVPTEEMILREMIELLAY
jgi:2-oxoisovalerate dehydrogenase E1 component